METKKRSWVSWLLEWSAPQKPLYLWSVLLAVGNVILKLIPYFLIADVVRMILGSEAELSRYLIKAALIALSFIAAELLHSASTTLSHKATFEVLSNIRKMLLRSSFSCTFLRSTGGSRCGLCFPWLSDLRHTPE